MKKKLGLVVMATMLLSTSVYAGGNLEAVDSSLVVNTEDTSDFVEGKAISEIEANNITSEVSIEGEGIESQVMSIEEFEVLYPDAEVITLNGEESDEKISISNQAFYLTTTAWKVIGSENNTFDKQIFIANSSINTQNLAVEVRASDGRLLGQNLSIAPGYGFTVNIPYNSGKYNIYAHAVGSNGDYFIDAYDK